jgi:PAS domain S-box-containing protein
MFVDLATVRQALECDELEPFFQPIVEIRTGRLTGFEVLARWKHPQLGLMLPENFIPLAEEDGLVGLLMRQILRKAFLSGPLFPARLVLAANVSPSQLRDPSLPGQIREAAAEAGFPMERLTIEITESGLIGNLDLAQRIARELKDMGCRLALDDFGTGFPSLRHLQALPFDELKIDRSFVNSITTARESRKIVAAIVGLGHSLGLNTVAEGVETAEQVSILLWLDCEFAQGWLYGRPMSADLIPERVTATPWRLSGKVSTRDADWAVSSLEALPEQRLAQLQAIYNGAPVGLCFLDRKLRYVSINRRLADMNGAPVSAHLGRTAMEMIPNIFPTVEQHILRALQGEATEDVEVFKPASGPRKTSSTILCSYQPAFDEAGDVIGVSVAVVDISERKRVEAALSETEKCTRS